MVFNVVTINIGLPKKIVYDGSKAIISAIKKKPISGRLYLGKKGLEGDGWADLRFHGGMDKAVCAYNEEHYPHWENKLSKILSPGVFGENFTLCGANEAALFLGDIYRAGDVEIQVSQPRIPCHKLNKIFGRNDMVREVKKLGFTGFYFRVLKTGKIKAGDSFTCVRRQKMSLSIAEVNRLLTDKKINSSGIEKVLDLDYVSEDFKKDLKKRL